MTAPDLLWPQLRRLLPDADLVVLPRQHRTSTWIGGAAVHHTDLETDIEAVTATAAGHLAALWPVLTAGLAPPATVTRTSLPGAAGTTSVELAARHLGPVPDLRARLEHAAEALRGEGWTLRRRPGPVDSRLLIAVRSDVAAELLRWPDPFALDVAVRVGPVRTGGHAEPAATLPFPTPATPGR